LVLGSAQVAAIDHQLGLNMLVLFFWAGTVWPLCLVPMSGIAYGVPDQHPLWVKLLILIGGMYLSAVVITFVLYLSLAPRL
jgi:hypothetical protein